MDDRLDPDKPGFQGVWKCPYCESKNYVFVGGNVFRCHQCNETFRAPKNWDETLEEGEGI